MGSSQMRQGTASRPSRRRTAALRLGTLQDHARTLLTAPCSARSRSPRQEGRPGVRARQETRPARRGSVEDVESAQPDQCQACAQACVASGRSVSAPRRVSCLRPKPPAFGRQSQPVRSCLAQPDGVLPWPQHPRCKCRWCRAPPNRRCARRCQGINAHTSCAGQALAHDSWRRSWGHVRGAGAATMQEVQHGKRQEVTFSRDRDVLRVGRLVR